MAHPDGGNSGSGSQPASGNDDEFDYDLESSRREQMHQQNFSNARMPAHLISLASNQALGSVDEGDEEREDPGEGTASVAFSDHTAKRSLWSDRPSTHTSSFGPPSTNTSSFGMQNIGHIEPMLARHRTPSEARRSQDAQSVADVDVEAFSGQVRGTATPEVPSSWSLFQPSENNYMTDALSNPEQQAQPSISNLASTQLLRLLNAGKVDGSWPADSPRPLDDNSQQPQQQPQQPQGRQSSSSLTLSSSSSQVNIDANFISALVPVAPAGTWAAAARSTEHLQQNEAPDVSLAHTVLPANGVAGISGIGSIPQQLAGPQRRLSDSSSFAGFLQSSAAIAAEHSGSTSTVEPGAAWLGPRPGSAAAGAGAASAAGDHAALDLSDLEVSLAGLVGMVSGTASSGQQVVLEHRPLGEFDLSTLVLAKPVAEQEAGSSRPAAAAEEEQRSPEQPAALAAEGAPAAEDPQPHPAPPPPPQPPPGPQQQEPDEWDLANQARQAALQPADTTPTSSAATLPEIRAAAAQLASQAYAAAEHYFLTLPLPDDIQQQVSEAMPAPSGCLLFMRKPNPAAQQQLRQLFGLAKLAFDDTNPQHTALLQAVHAAYTHTSTPAARYGPHWDVLGFQGTDPATDLRGCGMLGLLHLLALQQHCSEAAERVFRLSRDPIHGFPMAIVSINITKWVLQAARAGSLAALARKDASKAGAGPERALWRASVAMLAGCWYELYVRWLRGGKTMVDSGVVLKQLQEYCLGHVAAVVAKGQARVL